MHLPDYIYTSGRLFLITQFFFLDKIITQKPKIKHRSNKKTLKKLMQVGNFIQSMEVSKHREQMLDSNINEILKSLEFNVKHYNPAAAVVRTNVHPSLVNNTSSNVMELHPQQEMEESGTDRSHIENRRREKFPNERLVLKLINELKENIIGEDRERRRKDMFYERQFRALFQQIDDLKRELKDKKQNYHNIHGKDPKYFIDEDHSDRRNVFLKGHKQNYHAYALDSGADDNHNFHASNRRQGQQNEREQYNDEFNSQQNNKEYVEDRENEAIDNGRSSQGKNDHSSRMNGNGNTENTEFNGDADREAEDGQRGANDGQRENQGTKDYQNGDYQHGVDTDHAESQDSKYGEKDIRENDGKTSENNSGRDSKSDRDQKEDPNHGNNQQDMNEDTNRNRDDERGADRGDEAGNNEDNQRDKDDTRGKNNSDDRGRGEDNERVRNEDDERSRNEGDERGRNESDGQGRNEGDERGKSDSEERGRNQERDRSRDEDQRGRNESSEKSRNQENRNDDERNDSKNNDNNIDRNSRTNKANDQKSQRKFRSRNHHMSHSSTGFDNDDSKHNTHDKNNKFNSDQPMHQENAKEEREQLEGQDKDGNSYGKQPQSDERNTKEAEKSDNLEKSQDQVERFNSSQSTQQQSEDKHLDSNNLKESRRFDPITGNIKEDATDEEDQKNQNGTTIQEYRESSSNDQNSDGTNDKPLGISTDDAFYRLHESKMSMSESNTLNPSTNSTSFNKKGEKVLNVRAEDIKALEDSLFNAFEARLKSGELKGTEAASIKPSGSDFDKPKQTDEPSGKLRDEMLQNQESVSANENPSVNAKEVAKSLEEDMKTAIAENIPTRPMHAAQSFAPLNKDQEEPVSNIWNNKAEQTSLVDAVPPQQGYSDVTASPEESVNPSVSMAPPNGAGPQYQNMQKISDLFSKFSKNRNASPSNPFDKPADSELFEKTGEANLPNIQESNINKIVPFNVPTISSFQTPTMYAREKMMYYHSNENGEGGQGQLPTFNSKTAEALTPTTKNTVESPTVYQPVKSMGVNYFSNSPTKTDSTKKIIEENATLKSLKKSKNQKSESDIEISDDKFQRLTKTPIPIEHFQDEDKWNNNIQYSPKVATTANANVKNNVIHRESVSDETNNTLLPGVSAQEVYLAKIR